MKRRTTLMIAGGLAIAAVTFLLGQATRNDGSKPHSETLPIIGIATLTSDSYITAIQKAGGIPITLPTGGGSTQNIEHYLELLDGLVMPGGADIPPSEWGEEPHPTTVLLSDDRYQFEKALITRWVEETEKPLLGICLGSQWINVIHGGSLVQDIPSEFEVSHRDTTHPVTLAEDSKLQDIFGKSEFEVNSRHHQAARNIGAGLRAVATCPDGIIEAVETKDPDRFLIGVQWHPENMIEENPMQAKLFDAFVQAARDAKTP